MCNAIPQNIEEYSYFDFIFLDGNVFDLKMNSQLHNYEHERDIIIVITNSMEIYKYFNCHRMSKEEDKIKINHEKIYPITLFNMQHKKISLYYNGDDQYIFVHGNTAYRSNYVTWLFLKLLCNEGDISYDVLNDFIKNTNFNEDEYKNTFISGYIKHTKSLLEL
jgi:hypothetical protein